VESAERLGLSLKRFRGWEPTTTVRHTWDRDNLSEQPDGYTSTVEPEWDEVEQAWMIALNIWRANRCPGCGGDLSVTTKPENEERFQPELPLECFRCVAYARSHEAYEKYPRPQAFVHQVPARPNRKRG
jgi:hypothetical protein